ncbi:MAG: signal peptidase I [Geobacteraceae bacterium GWB2_52_12]|nr:MAG: signal peptidase I [Geobacteraceae bacterium GWB2_52_12]
MTSGFPMTVLLLALALFLLIIVGQWVIFQKAGQAGWKSLIPFYNMYILMVISGKPGWWMFLLFVPLVNVIIFLFAFLSLAKKFGRSELFGIGLFLLPMIFIPLLAFSGSEYEG